MMGKLHLLRYLLAVYRELPGSWKQKIKILRGLKHCILDYVSDSGDITYDKLLKRFGKPKQVAFTYVNEMETDELIQEIKVSKKIVNIVLATAVIMVLIWTVKTAISYIDHVKDANGYAIVEIIEYERIELEDDE